MAVVDQVEPHARDSDLMHREGPAGDVEPGHHVGDAVAREHGDLALVQPRQALGMETGEPLLERVEIASRVGAPRVATGRNEQYVSAPDSQTLARFGGFEIADADRFVRSEEGAVASGGHV